MDRLSRCFARNNCTTAAGRHRNTKPSLSVSANMKVRGEQHVLDLEFDDGIDSVGGHVPRQLYERELVFDAYFKIKILKC